MHLDLNHIYREVVDWIILFGPRVLFAAAVLFIGLWLIRLFKRWFFSVLDRKSWDSSLKPFLQSSVVTLLHVLLLFGVLQILGIEMTIFAALIGGIGVAAGLALSGTLQNFTSRILILILRPYRIGDNIVAQGNEGKVK